MKSAVDADAEARTVTVNLSTRYLAIGVEMLVGLLVLPFNIAHLGKAAYGLWVLTTSVTAYFSVLDMGYSGAIVKFVAEHRARRDTRALNEVLSTTFYLYAGPIRSTWSRKTAMTIATRYASVPKPA